MSSIHRVESPSVAEDGVRFGRTLLRVQCGMTEHSRFDVMVLPNNRRGLLGVNYSGGVRIDGGLDVEREAMAQAPLTLGTAITTGAGTLEALGTQTVVHAVVADQLGDAPRELALRQAVNAAIRTVDGFKGRHVAIVPLGSGSATGRIDRANSVPIMIEEIIGHLRRSSSRIESITFLCNSAAEKAELGGLLERMRRDWWGARG